MAVTFNPPVNPSFPLSMREAFRINAVKFGDGFTQRSSDGLNAAEQEVQLVWENVTTEEKEAIQTFLRARKGVEPFTCPFLPETSRQYVCGMVEDERIAPSTYVVTATITEVFDL